MSGKAFVVVGMHRSGTSAVARLLNLAGAAISERLMVPQADNPKGFWESLPIAELHDEALGRMGLAWDSIERIPRAWFESADAATMRTGMKAQLLADFPEGQSFVVKDPRVCRFIPAWLQVLAELEYAAVAIMPVRNPLEVAQSLQCRNGFPIAKSLLLWLRHVLDAEAATRQVPRAIIDYDRLLHDWRAELREVNRQLGFTCFAETVFFEEHLSRFLSADDRHHVASTSLLREADQRGWVVEAFEALAQLRAPADADARQAATRTLDRVSQELNAAEDVLEPFLGSYRNEVREARTAQATSAARLSSVEAEAREQLGRHAAALEEARHEAARLSAQVESRNQSLARVRADLARTRSVLTVRSNQLDEAALRSRQLTEQLAAADRDNEALRRDRQQLRSAWEQSEREAVRAAAAGHAHVRRCVALPGRPEALLRLLMDAQVRPSRWLAEPLRSARNLWRLSRRDYRERVTLLARSGLFDLDYYARTTSGVAANLVARFLLAGDAAGERPHALFDPAWYRLRNPDLPHATPALQHYLTVGGWELRSPHPLFDPRFYLSQWEGAAVDGMSPLSHFLEVGGPAGLSPHPLFDTFHYLRARRDVAAAGVNPLLHYLTAGEDDVADPHPLFSNRYYLAQNPDVRGISALEHFVRYGAAEGRSPHPLFDVRFYWQQRPDVQASSVNALEHFLAVGAADLVDPHPGFSCRSYIARFGEHWDRRANPLVHYLRWGSGDLQRPGS